MGQKRSGPGGNRGHAQAGVLSAWDVYRRAVLDEIQRASDHLSEYARATDTPARAAVEAADLLDAARDALEGAA